jgi:hypothetical protein
MLRRCFGLVLAVAVVAACGQSTPPSSAQVGAPPSDLAAASLSPAPSAVSSAVPSSSPSSSPTATPAPTASPSPTPEPTPTPWLSYKSKRYRYTMNYPPTWVVTPGSAGLADQFDDYGSQYVYVSRDTVNGTISVNLTVTHQIAYYKSHYKAKLLSRKSVTVAKWPGRLLTFKGTDDGQNLYFQVLILGKGRVAYFVEWLSLDDDRKADQAMFKKIYKTFKPRS